MESISSEDLCQITSIKHETFSSLFSQTVLASSDTRDYHALLIAHNDSNRFYYRMNFKRTWSISPKLHIIIMNSSSYDLYRYKN